MCVYIKWLVLTNWLLGCSTSLSLAPAPALVTLSQDPRSHNPARDFRVSPDHDIHDRSQEHHPSWWHPRGQSDQSIRGNKWAGRLHQRRLMSRLTFCSVSVSRLNTLSPSLSGSVPLNILGASLIYYLPFTGILHHNLTSIIIFRETFSFLLSDQQNVNVFCIIECIFQWISLLSKNWNINSKKFWPG